MSLPEFQELRERFLRSICSKHYNAEWTTSTDKKLRHYGSGVRTFVQKVGHQFYYSQILNNRTGGNIQLH